MYTSPKWQDKKSKLHTSLKWQNVNSNNNKTSVLAHFKVKLLWESTMSNLNFYHLSTLTYKYMSPKCKNVFSSMSEDKVWFGALSSRNLMTSLSPVSITITSTHPPMIETVQNWPEHLLLQVLVHGSWLRNVHRGHGVHVQAEDLGPGEAHHKTLAKHRTKKISSQHFCKSSSWKLTKGSHNIRIQPCMC